jgi:transposase
LLKKKSKGTLGLERARAIIDAAGNSIGIREGRDALELELRQLLVRMELVRKQLSEIEQTIKGVIKKVPYIEILSSIPQVGQITLATILGEAGDFRQYQNVSQIIKLSGLNLYEISSGQHRGRKRITKRGRPLLRQMLYLAGLRLIKQEGVFSQFYKRLVEKGKAKPQAIVAMGCKLLRVLFAMVRDNRKFEEKDESPLLIVNQVRELSLIGA